MAKVSFGMIVKNGFPFVKYSIETVLPFAYEVIVIDGGSSDGTIDYLKSLNDKITLIQGLYDDKNEQCNDYLKLSTGDWIWQLDCDEIYKQDELKKAIEWLDSTKDEVFSIKIINFYRTINTTATGGIWNFPPVRVFRKNIGDKYINHRPPTLQRISGKVIKSNGECIPEIYIYHYSHIGKEPVKRKSEYYTNLDTLKPEYKNYMQWYKEVYLSNKTNELHINKDGILQVFTEEHPDIIKRARLNGELKEFE